MDILIFVLDLALALGAALRLTRFIVADDVPGQWYVKDPLDRLIHRDPAREKYEADHLAWQERNYHATEIRAGEGVIYEENEKRDAADVEPQPPPEHSLKRLRWHRYLEGLGCPYCMSVWFSAFVVLTLFLAGGPGDAADWWRYPAGFLTLAWLTGHIAARVGDHE